MEDQEVELLAAKFDAFLERFEDFQTNNRGQHQENVATLRDQSERLRRLEVTSAETLVQTSRTNGRVTALEQAIKLIEQAVDKLFAIAKAIPMSPADLDKSPLNIGSLSRLVAFGVACIVGTWFVITQVLGYAAPFVQQVRP